MTQHWRHALILSALSALFIGACGEALESDNGGAAEPCGIRACTESEEAFEVSFSEPAAGKADAVERVVAALVEVTLDGELDVADVDTLFEAAGGRVSRGEIIAIRDAVFSEDLTYDVTDDAAAHTSFRARTANLTEPEITYAEENLTYAMTEIPDEVSALLVKARLNGAVAYDVNEVDDDGDRVWTPYPATTEALENMTFEYTQITPAALIEDISNVDIEYNAIVGSEEQTSPSGQTYRAARYEARKGGTGNILSHYDEVYHPDIFARGRQGQKWANNFAILSDGSVHCLPASRRSYKQDLILTNPHLSRGAMLLFNGHLDVRAGVVVGVEMSGRLSKLAARGKANFIDPLSLLEAWGFEIADNITIRYGNTERGVPTRDADAGILRKADEEIIP